MSFGLKAFGLLCALGWIGFSGTPVLAGSCALACRAATGGLIPDATALAETRVACEARCTPTPCAAGTTCVATFTDIVTPPTPPAPAFVCACGCLNPGTTTPTIPISSTHSCTAARNSDPDCTAPCTALCAAGTTASTPPVLARATLAPTNGAACAIAPVTRNTTPTPEALTPEALTLPDSSAPPPTNADRAAVPITLSQPIDGVTVVTDVGNYIAVVYRYMIGLAGTAAVIMIVYGGFLYLLGSSTGSVSEGKKIIQDAIIGLLLVLGSYTILSTVNPNTLSLKLPNIQKIVPVALPDASTQRNVCTCSCNNIANVSLPPVQLAPITVDFTPTEAAAIAVLTPAVIIATPVMAVLAPQIAILTTFAHAHRGDINAECNSSNFSGCERACKVQCLTNIQGGAARCAPSPVPVADTGVCACACTPPGAASEALIPVTTTVACNPQTHCAGTCQTICTTASPALRVPAGATWSMTPSSAVCAPASPPNVCACHCKENAAASAFIEATTKRSCGPPSTADNNCRPFCLELCINGNVGAGTPVVHPGMVLDAAPTSAFCAGLPPTSPAPAPAP